LHFELESAERKMHSKKRNIKPWWRRSDGERSPLKLDALLS